MNDSGTPHFRRYDRELVLKPAISLKKSWGVYVSKTLRSPIQKKKANKWHIP